MTLHRFIIRCALSLAHVFAWVFAFHYFYISTGSVLSALVSTAMSYALTQVLVVLLTPYSAQRLRHGARGMLVRASLLLAAALAVYAAALSGLLGNIGWGIGIFAVLMGVYRAWYWVPYHVHAEGGGRLPFLAELIVAVAPLVTGLALAATPYAPVAILGAAAILVLLSMIPLYSLSDTHEGFSWGYRQTFHELFSSVHRMPLLSAFFSGFEAAALLLLWPIVVFTLVGWSYATLGLVLSLTFLATMLVRALFRYFKWSLRSPAIHSILIVSAWVLRGTVAAPLAIVLVDTYYHSTTKPGVRGIDHGVHEQIADSHTYVDEFTALKEMGQGIGRIFFCAALVILASFYSFPIVILALFALAALSAVLSIVCARSAPKSV